MDEMRQRADTWFVHRFTLDPKKGSVLRGDETTLALTGECGGFRAEFELARGEDPIQLCRNLIGSESYRGRGDLHYARVVHLAELDALFGHVTANAIDVRDLFVAIRNRRVDTPRISDHCFPTPWELSLYDHQQHQIGDRIWLRLKKPSGYEVEIKGKWYPVDLQPVCTGGLAFRKVTDGPEGAITIGGLVLPLDKEAKHLVLLCFHHHHSEAVHSTRTRDGDTVGDVAGHPACTTAYAAYAPLAKDEAP
jgi:hypothetical protein